MKKNKKQLLNRIALGLVLSTTVCGTVFAVPAANTVPTGPANVTGANSWATAGTAANPILNVTQDTASTNAQINWNTFSIGKDAIVNFIQNSSNQTLVNKVITNNMSEIYGKMNASGNIVLVNPNGIILAKGSEINAGGFAAYAAAGTKLTDAANRINEGNIIADGTINVGVGTAKALAKQFGVTNFAVGLGSASSFGNANKIALVANGDVTVNKDAKLTAVDTTTSTGASNQGAEGFNMGGVSSSVTGTVYIRPDANDNDYGQVYISDGTGSYTSGKGNKQITANAVDIYYNAAVKGTATTDDNVLYNKKDYANDGGKKWSNLLDNATTVTKTDATLNTDAGTVVYTTKDGQGTGPDVTGYALVHNMAQLQDIDTTINGKANTDGKLDGTYALGRDLYAQKDELGGDYSSIVKNTSGNTIIFTTTDGAKVTAISGKDSGIFTSNTTKQLLNGQELKYTAALPTVPATVSAKVGTVTYTYNGNTIKDTAGNTYVVTTNEDGYAATKNGVAITDTSLVTTLAGLTIARNEFQDQADLTTYLGMNATDVAKNFAHMNTSSWNNNQGFDPIGNAATPFTGTIFGIGGDVIHIGDNLSEVHTIYHLPIDLPTTDNVGLVGVGSGATIDYVQEADTSITGHKNVGGMMGQALNGSTITDSANIGNGIAGVTDITKDSGYVRTTSTDQVSNIGGLVGDLENSSIVESANSATIIGQVDPIDNLNVKNVGGLAGTANGATIVRSVNQGNVFGEEKTGGIAGNAINTTIGATPGSLDDPTETVYNNGRITGTKDTGGIAGYGSNIHMYGVYNTNEDSPLSGNSQYIINPDGTIRGVNPAFTMRKGNKYNSDGHMEDLSDAYDITGTKITGQGIYSDAALSGYGAITGKENTGGLVGEMESTSTIDTAYNAGNITGGKDTGGLVGKLNTTQDATYTTNIKNAYNGDNNTVIREDLGTIPDAVKGILGATFDPVQNGTSTVNQYSFNAGDANYYSFYTMSGNTKTYYYFIPAGGKTEAGAGGAFVKADGTFVKNSDLPDANERIYTNRVAYKDANITGTTNTGGLFGEMNSGVVTTTYDTGTVNKGVAGNTTGALVGTKTGGTLSTSFFANDSDKTTAIEKKYSGQTNAIGNTTADASVQGNTLAHWRDSDNIKALSNDGSFVGDAAAVDAKTGYQKFTGQDKHTYYWTTQGDVYYYTDEVNKTGKTTVIQYDKTTGNYRDIINNVNYTIDKNETKAIEENAGSATGSSEWVYQTVVFHNTGAATEKDPATLTLNYVTRASNETSDNTWIEYPAETTPLLEHFMFAENITRHFTYDAKTHNLKTDDVNNIYGRADFTDGVSGKNVNVKGQAQSADPDHQGESEYFFNSTAIWSPQHGYKLNANVSITIKAQDLDIDIQGTRTYGDAGNTTGYYVVVPYKEELTDKYGRPILDTDNKPTYGPQEYAYYTVNDGSTTTPYTAMTVADWTWGGKDYRTNPTAPTPTDLKALCDAKATYMATYNGVAALEAVDVNQAVQTVIKALKVNSDDPNANNAITYTSAGNGLTQIITKNDPATYTLGDQSLEAGVYNNDDPTNKYNVVGITYDPTTGKITNQATANIGGIGNDHKDYNVKYTGGLTVNKADLYYTYDGEKVYGDANGKDGSGNLGKNTYTLVGKEDNSTTTSVNGYLKSFDSGKLTTDANGVITAGANVTTNGLVGDGSFVMSGTPQANTNITDNGEQSITQGPSGNAYYQVMVDPADGTLKTYKVTKFANGTMSISAANTSAEAAAYINKNYNMVWKSDTTVDTDKARTTTKNASGATVLSNGNGVGYASAGTDVHAQASSELITPRALDVTVTGKRVYGDAMTKDAYTHDQTELTNNLFNVSGSAITGNTESGLAAGDTMGDIVSDSQMKSIVNGVEDTYANVATAHKINERTDADTYGLTDGSDNSTQYPGSRVNVETTTGTGTYKHYDILNANNYNYIISNGKHTETITPETVTITTTGSRTYGDANSTSTINIPTASGFETWDSTKWTTTIANDLQQNVQNQTGIGDHAGKYGTKDYTNDKYTNSDPQGALYYLKAQKDEVSNAFGKNYAIDYQDTYTINKAPLTVTVTGERQYGSNMTANGNYTTSEGTANIPNMDANPDPMAAQQKIYDINVDGLKNNDHAADILNKAGVQGQLATVDSGAGDNTTTVGSHTNVGKYTADSTGAKFTLDNTNAIDTTNTILSSGDYYVLANGTNTLKIVPKKITITTSGEKTYDSENPAAADYTVDTSQVETWDSAKIANVNTWKENIYNPATKTTAKGNYGTVNGTAAYLRYGGNNGTVPGSYENTVKSDIGGNYDVTFADSFIINGKPVTISYVGERTYGASGNVTNVSLTEEGIDSNEVATLWTAHKDAWQGQYDDVTAANTHHGVYGKSGTTGNAYVSGAMTLSPDEKTSLEGVLSNYTVTYTDKLTINPKDLTLVTTGERTYGDANSTINYGLIVDKDAALANQADKALLANYQTTLKNAIQVDSSITERSHAGSYGTEGTLSGNNAVLTYSNDQKDHTSAQLNGDYNIKYEDKLTIDKRNATLEQTGTKDYGTGAEHTVYDPVDFTNSNIKDWDQADFGNKTITNNSDRTTNVGTYTNSLMTVTYDNVPASNDYIIDTKAVLKVTPADFTYTSDHTSYWQYQHIPAQTGKVTNKYGEDVSDLVGTLTWPTPADGKVVGIFPVWGRGSNDNSGNYHAIQAAGNPTALEVKQVPKNEQTDSALNENLEGAWQSFRRPLLDIMYLKIKDNGFKSWDNGVFVTANPYVPAGDKTNYGIITFNGQVLK